MNKCFIIFKKIKFFNENDSEILRNKLYQVVTEIHCERIIEKIFDLILYFPDTYELIIEFKDTLHSTG